MKEHKLILKTFIPTDYMMRIRCNVVRDILFTLKSSSVYNSRYAVWAVFRKHAFYVMRLPTDFQQFLTVDNFFGSDAIIHIGQRRLISTSKKEIIVTAFEAVAIKLSVKWNLPIWNTISLDLFGIEYTRSTSYWWKWKFNISRTSDSKMNNKHNSRLFIMHQYYKEISNWYFGWNWIQNKRMNKHLQFTTAKTAVDCWCLNNNKKEE